MIRLNRSRASSKALSNRSNSRSECMGRGSQHASGLSVQFGTHDQGKPKVLSVEGRTGPVSAALDALPLTGVLFGIFAIRVQM